MWNGVTKIPPQLENDNDVDISVVPLSEINFDTSFNEISYFYTISCSMIDICKILPCFSTLVDNESSWNNTRSLPKLSITELEDVLVTKIKIWAILNRVIRFLMKRNFELVKYILKL